MNADIDNDFDSSESNSNSDLFDNDKKKHKPSSKIIDKDGKVAKANKSPDFVSDDSNQLKNDSLITQDEGIRENSLEPELSQNHDEDTSKKKRKLKKVKKVIAKGFIHRNKNQFKDVSLDSKANKELVQKYAHRFLKTGDTQSKGQMFVARTPNLKVDKDLVDECGEI